MNKTINISGRAIGEGQPCFIIAEAGVNHNGSLDLAKQLVAIAAEAGADSVKFQTFSAKRLVGVDVPKAEYQLQHTATEESQQEMLSRLELTKSVHYELLEYCQQKNILFLSTPFDELSADFLYSIGVPIFKISSGDITNFPLLENIASKEKPIILSTGMSSLGEVEKAIECINKTGNNQIILLHCVSSYPAAFSDVNLKAMQTMKMAFGYPVGFSDHTLGIEASLAAVALGACVIEKHFTLDRNLPGPDHQASLSPSELTCLVSGIRNIELALGDGIKIAKASEISNKEIGRRSLFWKNSLSAGSIVREEDMIALRPGNGLPPEMIKVLSGKKVSRDTKQGEKVDPKDFEISV